MDYWLLFWRTGAAELADVEVARRLRAGDWQCVQAGPELADFRRDLIASDPDWTSFSLRPHPGGSEPDDRYLALVLGSVPDESELRDLRYVAARNRLMMFDPQTEDPQVGELT